MPATLAAKFVAFEKMEEPATPSPLPLQTTVLETNVEKSSTNLKPVLQMPQLERPQTDLDPGAIFQVNSSVKTYSPERRDVNNVKPLLTDMVIIQGGNVLSRKP